MIRSLIRASRIALAYVIVQMALSFVPDIGQDAWWTDTAVRWYSDAIIVSFCVWAAWNAWPVIVGIPAALEERRERRAEERMQAQVLTGNTAPAMLQAAMVQGAVSMSAARAGAAPLRYALPPSFTFTGPQPRVMEYITEYEVIDGVRVPGPVLSAQEVQGTCGKCAQPMSRHAYYGTGSCVIALTQGQSACTGCEACGGWVHLPAGLFIPGWAYFCDQCRLRHRLP